MIRRSAAAPPAILLALVAGACSSSAPAARSEPAAPTSSTAGSAGSAGSTASATASPSPPPAKSPQEKPVFEVTPDQAKAAGLPALRVRLDTTGVPMRATATPEPGKLVIVSGPPGGVLQLDVWTTDVHDTNPAAIERAVRARFNKPFYDPLVIGAPAKIDLAGAKRDALAVITGKDATRAAWCAAIVPAGGASTLVTIGMFAGEAPAVSCDEILGHPLLGKLAGTLQISAS